LPAEIGTSFLFKWNNAVPARIRKVSTWLGWMWNAGIIMLLSFGFSPGSQGGRVNAIEVLFDWRFGSFRNETEERPDSIEKVVRCARLVLGVSVPLRKENMIVVIFVKANRCEWLLIENDLTKKYRRKRRRIML
jgi:hypothetical protein